MGLPPDIFFPNPSDPVPSGGGGGGFDFGNIVNDLPGILGFLNGFGFGGNGLTSGLTGIPPQELQLLTDEHGLMGNELQQEMMRNNIIGTMFPQFLSNVNAINPGAVNPFINNINKLVSAGTGDINAATPDINAMVTGLEGMSPDINALDTMLQSRMNLGSPYYQQHQREAMTSDAQKFNQFAGQLTGMMAPSGFGSAPSGLATAELGDFTRGAGATTAEDYLQNLFQNENLSMTAAGMFPQVPQLRATQAGGFGTAGGQRISQGLGMGQMANAEGGAGQLALGGQQLQATKAGLLNPIPAFKSFPRVPSFPVNVGALPGMGKSDSGGGGGGILGDIFGGIGALFGL